MKECKHCETLKPLGDFHRSSKKRDGRSSWCKECSKEGRLKFYKENPELERERKAIAKKGFRDWFISLKAGKSCGICGGVFHHAAMHWHHLEDKVGCISDMTSKKRILEEIEKCQLVCANCHAVLTWDTEVP